MGKRRRRPIIPYSWLHLAPGRPPSFWLRVKEKVKKTKGVRMQDLEKVKLIVDAEPFPIKTSSYEEKHYDEYQ